MSFTIIELLIAMAIFIIVIFGIYYVYNISHIYFKAGSAFMKVAGSGRNSIERIIRPIRQANSVLVTDSGNRIEIRYDKNEIPTSSTSDDTNIAFYFDGAANRIYFDSDNNPSTQDTVLTSNVMKIGTSNIFSKSSDKIIITYKIQDDYTVDGYQAQDIYTTVMMRN